MQQTPNEPQVRFTALPRNVVLRRRGLKKEADKNLPVPGEFPKTSGPLSVVQMDHTPLDILVVYHRDHLRYGQLYCSRCLDAQPYCRTFWRLSHYWICEEHGEYLLDACRHCDMPFVPYRHDSMILRRCRWCWRRLDHGSERIRPGADEIAYQRYVRCVVDDCTELGQVARREIRSILTGYATNDPRFKRAGEPWSWWRIADRAELFRVVEAEIRGLPTTVADPVCKSNKRHKRKLTMRVKSVPATKGERRSHRARRLLQSALRYRPFRKMPARVKVDR